LATIALHGIRKVFSGGHIALGGIDLAIADGERLALVGPSGSGKSSLLRVIAGLELPSGGRIEIAGRDVTDLPPEQRDLAMVFQSYALYPHKTVRQNLAFGLRMRRTPPLEIDQRVRAVAESLGIDALLERMPAQLSGGQRQRVALGRAIVRAPHAFLFDEPLSNLDPQLRVDTRAELIQLHDRLRTTMVYVTHDQEEAMTLGQRIAVMRSGMLQQVATPAELFERPASIFVATFIGSPAMNLIAAPSGGTMGVRPHDVEIAAPGIDADLRGTVVVVEPLGHAQIVHVSTTSGRILVVASPDAIVEKGAAVGLRFRPDRLHHFDADGLRISGADRGRTALLDSGR
jgi:ABC-type sugar transport system ATPase subunit